MANVAEVFKKRLLWLARNGEPALIIHSGAVGVEHREPVEGCRFSHVADHYEIVSPVRGKSCIALPNRTVELEPGELLLIEKGVNHSEIMAEPPEAYEIFWCHVRGSSALLTETRFFPPSTWKSVGPVELGGRSDLESIAAAIASELTARQWGWENSARGLLYYLISIVVRRLDRAQDAKLRFPESPTVHADPRTWGIVRGVLEWCEANSRKGVRLKDVADAVGYSPSYLSRLISRHLGRSLSEHLHRRRMEAAKQLLEGSDLPVRRVAEQLGYADPAHFSRAFARAVGVPPQTYRRRCADQ